MMARQLASGSVRCCHGERVRHGEGRVRASIERAAVIPSFPFLTVSSRPTADADPEEHPTVGAGSGAMSADAVETDRILAGGGEVGVLMRAMDWSTTPLGPVASWPQSLRTAVNILLNSRYPMFVFWGPRLIKIYNDAYRPITGAKHPWALGKPGTEVWPEIWDAIGPMVERVVDRGEATWSDDLMLVMHRSGFPEEVYFTFSYSPIQDEAGGIGGMFCACTETTGKVVGERRLRVLRDLAAVSADARTVAEACRASASVLAGCLHEVPFSYLYLTGADGGARLAARSGTDATDDPALAAHVRAVLAAGRAAVIDDLASVLARVPPGPWPEPPTTAVVLPLADRGRERPIGALVLGASARRPFDADARSFFELVAAQVSASLASVGAIEDERLRAESLAELDRAKTTFFSNISHEFRTPLTLMLGPTEDLLAGAHGELAPAQRAQLELIRRSELRLHRLVNALLDFSRIEAGRAQASYEPVDLVALTRELASSFRAAIERAGLRFVVDTEPLPAPVFVDREMWERIVLNLVSNAFKFTFEGSITISLRAAGDAVVLRVADTGVGVPEHEVPRLFERFHRVEGTRARTHEGSGIGLALVHELVRLHGGTITAESRFGAGTTFTVTLPTGSAHLPADRIAAAGSAQPTLGAEAFRDEALRWLAEPSAPGPAVAPEGARVLVVDDNADMRDYLRRILAAIWSVDVASDGTAALAAVRTRRPDLIVTDIMMPGLDGFGLLRAVRGDPRTAAIPVIMLSARAGEEARVEGLEAGADDYLVKPFAARELVARVRTHLELATLREGMRRQREDLHALVMQAPVGIAVVRGPELVYELANPQYRAIVGGRDVVGKRLLDALPEVRGRGYEDRIREVMATGEPWLLREERITFASGRDGGPLDTHVSFVGVPIHGGDGATDRVMFVVSDVTAEVESRRDAEAAQHHLVHSEAALRRVMVLRDEFLSVASHELRTPLTTVQLQADGLVEALARGGDADPTLLRARERAERLRREAARLARLVEEMIEVLDFDRGALQLNAEELDLASLVRGVVDRVGRETGSTSPITLRVEPVTGRWDRRRVEQVVAQLVANGLKFGADRPVDVCVAAAGDRARLAVTDRGIGIAPEDHERIFGRFERAASARHYGGFGLGLWLVRELVHAMGGAVGVESRPREGATFTVDLPRWR
jgi:signal transduction histidine kinase/CheY-like chemotaxis protein